MVQTKSVALLTLIVIYHYVSDFDLNLAGRMQTAWKSKANIRYIFT